MQRAIHSASRGFAARMVLGLITRALIATRLTAALALLVVPTFATANQVNTRDAKWTTRLNCEMDLACRGLFCGKREAKVELQEYDDELRVLLIGTHREPDSVLREKPKERMFEADHAPMVADHTYRFGDSQTQGLFSIAYTGKAALSLHVGGADVAYFEHYEGFCETL